MTFQKGHTHNQGKVNNPKGRPGFEWEEKRLKEMDKLLKNVFALCAKVNSDKATKEDYKKLGALTKIGCKVMDKLHASKQHTELDFPDNLAEVEIHIVKTKEDIKNNEKDSNTINDSIPEELGPISEETT